MPANAITDFSKLCIHTITTKPWNIETAVEKYTHAGVSGITVWRQWLEGRKPEQVGALLKDSGLEVVSYCRGGFFPSNSQPGLQKAIDDNKKAIDEAAAINAPLVVLVCGAIPGQALEISRHQIQEGIASILDHAKSSGVKLAIEPLHPMYADDRSAINTMKQANDLCEVFNDPSVGVAIDVYHLWWDPQLKSEIFRCGEANRIFAFHICDWLTPTKDLLNDRGLMGQGCIDIKQIRSWVEEAGFSRFHEVEIFSNDWWSQNQEQFLEKIKSAYLEAS